MRALVPVVVWVATVAPSTPAQTGKATDLQQAIARNEELLQQARVVVRESNSAKARAALEAAAKIHELSKSLLQSDARAAVVARVVQRAREAILSALNIARRETRSEESALRAMERAGERLHKARNVLAEYGSRDVLPARRLVEEAHAQLQRARDNMQEHLFSVSLQLARASFDMSSRAIQMLRRNAMRPDDVIREIERTDELLSRLIERAGDHPEHGAIRDAAAQAMNLQHRAHDSAGSGKYRIALEQTRRARMLALRIGRRMGTNGVSNAGDRVQRALEVTRTMIHAALASAKKQGDHKAVHKLGDAARLLQEANDRFRNGDLRAATRLNERARDLARRALTGADNNLSVDAVTRVLVATDAVIAQARDKIGDADGSNARLLERAQRHQKTAHNALDAGRLRRALTETKIARTLAARSLRESE